MRHLTIVTVWMLLIRGVSYPQSTLDPGAVSRPQGAASVAQPRVAIPPGPVIKAFTVSPERLDRRVDLVFNWQVEPSRTGSPIAEVKVVAGAIALHTTTAATGTYTFRAREWMYRSVFPPDMRGQKTFTLVAKTAAGATGRREAKIEVESVIPVIDRFAAQPTSPIRIGETITVRWAVSPGPAGIPITSVVVEEMAEDGSGRHSLYTGSAASGETRIETRASTLPGILRLPITVTNEVGVKAEREIRVTLMRPTDISQKPDMIPQVRDCSWFLEGLTPRLRFNYTVHNRGTIRTGMFSIRFMAWRGRGEYLLERTISGPDIAPGEEHQSGLTLSQEELRGATELYFGIDVQNRVAESNEGNNEMRVPIPPLPRPDMTAELRECAWFLEGLTPRLRFNYVVHNRGNYPTGPFSIRFMGWRGRGEYLIERTLPGPDIAPGALHQGGLTLSAEDLRGATELYFGVDVQNRVAESNEGNNEMRVSVPPRPR